MLLFLQLQEPQFHSESTSRNPCNPAMGNVQGLFHSGKVDKNGQLHARCDRSASVIADLARREIGGEDFTYWYLASVHAELEQ